MENGKKKRNKKKKNKRTDDETILSESTSVDDNHLGNGQNDHISVSENVDLLYQHGGETKHIALEETIEHLKKENSMHAHYKAQLEHTIKSLQEENSVHIQKVAGLELKLVQLEGEKHSWVQQEAELEEGIRQLQEQKTALDLERARLLETIDRLEREKTSLLVKEDLSRKTIIDQNSVISRLQAQVVELEESKRDLLQENKRLIVNVADYQQKVLNLEGRFSSTHSSDQLTKEVLSAQVDAARILVDKLITENGELIAKVNELFVELRRVAKTEVSSGVGREQIVGVAAAAAASFDDPEPLMIQNTSTSGQDELESIPIHDYSRDSSVVDLGNDSAGDEIAQIPLHENDNEEDRDAESNEEDVLLSDAPLIGAPFRIISFMAKYVTGADLVDKT